jgi:hypothetical protein
MKKNLLSCVIVLLVLIVSISYLSSVNQSFNPQISAGFSIQNARFKQILFLDRQDEDEKNESIRKDLESNRYDFVSKYPYVTKCNKYTSAQNSSFPLNENEEESYDYSSAAPNETHSQRIVKGVLVYFPIELSNDYQFEFRWLYRSWIEMQKHEPSKWRTDLIVFVQNDKRKFNDTEYFLHKLNCSFTNKRQSAFDLPMCTLIEYVPIKNRILDEDNTANYLKTNKERYDYVLNDVDIFSDDSENLHQFYKLVKDKLSNYGYLDSILMAFDGYTYLKSAGYDFLIRSDMDVFLTPGFS